MTAENESMDVAATVQPRGLTDSDRLAYSVEESAKLLGVHYFSVYRLIQRGRIRACRVLRGKLLVPRSELIRLLTKEYER